MSNLASFRSAFATQLRVVWAISLRDIHGKHGRSRLGYLWEILKTVFFVGIFWGIREVTGFKAPHGMSTGLFLLLGFIAWNIFSETVSLGLKVMQRHKALLTFSVVQPLDLFLGNAIVSWVTEIVIGGVFLLLLAWHGPPFTLYDPATLVIALISVGIFSFALSLVLGAMMAYLPFLEHIIPMIMRILFFTSGVFFSPFQMAYGYRELLLWHPLVNYIELLRGAFVYMSPSSEIRIVYLLCIGAIALALGLLLERHARLRWAAML